MIPNIFSLLGESIVGKHIAKGIIFSNSPKKFHPNGSRIQDIIIEAIASIEAFVRSAWLSQHTAVSHGRIDFRSECHIRMQACSVDSSVCGNKN